ncbi:SUR7/PalI family [Geosmithia morbida]|uniref:SUR7/PalI family n=1 Tax=Geosmithia morbida TaxID=1094350 RepID=A0A9P4YZ79_9HYPO|nr:SUR7/PalI family [Geosmithia morbida]KAF4124494.1 SUR7/PalI family [Geosmithia morbida]
MAKNGILGIAGLILMAASLLFLWFIVLSGLTSHTTPFSDTYFLRADTSGITGARDTTQWTYLYFCGEGNKDCSKARPAPAFGKAWSSNADSAPASLIGSHGGDTTSSRFFYLWRFGWVIILITLFFETLAFFSAFLACCGRLGAAISGSGSAVALFFHSVGSALTTATFVLARDAFHSDNRGASLGRYAFGFLWASWVGLFVATLLFCMGVRKDRGPSPSTQRRRSVRSTSYNGRRVKEEYA